MKTTKIIIMAIMFFLFGGVVGSLLQTLIGIKELEQAFKQKENLYQTQIAQKDNEIQTLQKALNDALSSRNALQEEVKTLQAKIDSQKRLESESGVFDYSYSELRELLTGITGIPAEDMPANDKQFGEYAQNLFKMMRGQSIGNTADKVENISFSLRVNPDNSPIDPKNTFKTSDRRIYSCFSNQGALTVLAKVITRWTNKTTEEVVRLDTKPIDPEAAYNFIWVEKRDGWLSGEYEVELFNVKTLKKIAEGKFTVVAEEDD